MWQAAQRLALDAQEDAVGESLRGHFARLGRVGLKQRIAVQQRPIKTPHRPADVEVVAAFDVDVRKVGRPLHEAAFAPPNCTTVISDHIEKSDVVVQMGPVLMLVVLIVKPTGLFGVKERA